MLFIHSTFLLCSLGCHILLQNCSVSLASGCCISPNLLVEFFMLFWNVLFCLYCFTLCRYLFNLSSFASIFWFISSSCIIIFSCVVFFFLFQHVSAFFLFVCFRILFICVSNRISHSGFDFLFVLFRGTPIFSQTDFAPHLIQSCFLLVYILILDLFFLFPS